MIETSEVTKQRIIKYLSEGKRFDGRKPDEYRELSIELQPSKKSEGSARVRLGKTEVIVGVKMDVSEPYPDSPNAGNLVVSAELLPLSSKKYEPGPPRIESIELGRVIDRGIRESKFIDFEKLCIKEKEKVWTIFIDIYSINDDGNLFDAAGIGAVAALRNARIPKYNEEEGRVAFGEWSKEKLPLKKETPLSITVHKLGDSLILDPTTEEEDSSETRITIAIADAEVIHSVQKGNSREITTEEFDKTLELVQKAWKDIYPKIEKFLK